jgi:uncharacterized C2H2 Zn-finger protein
MSLGEGSDYAKRRDDRTKINNLIGFGSESSQDFHRCPTCIEHWRLEIVNSPDGKRMGKCIRGCGNLFNLQKDEERPKNASRFGNKTSSFIITKDKSKDKKKSKFDTPNNELTDEDLRDIRNSGGLV